MVLRTYLVLLLLLLGSTQFHYGEWSGYVDFEGRWFPNKGTNSTEHFTGSISFKPTYEYIFDQGKQQFVFTPYGRLDSHDVDRSHADIRELSWSYAATKWELRTGLRKVFWGVAESQHLVDIINQTDLVDSTTQEEKLGQPMVNVAWITGFGTFDFFYLPWFRERTFSGRHGRFGFNTPIGDAAYESSSKDGHPDYAIRWYHYLGGWDIGLSYFSGTSRDPILKEGKENGQDVLIPFYQQIQQFGLDLQYTYDAWLLKFEGISRAHHSDRYAAFTSGFEYTFYGVFGTPADVGLLMEYSYDDRGDDALTPFNQDLFVGSRLATNGVMGTEMLLGGSIDTDHSTTSLRVEASQRLSDYIKLTLEGNLFVNVSSKDRFLHAIRSDDYIQFSVSFYY